MKRVEAQSYPVSIFIAGNMTAAEHICRDYCDEAGLCVTVAFARYIYTGGGEDGVVIGLINYPRFPTAPDAIWAHAETLAERVCASSGQQSYSIQSPDKTVWFSHRPEDNAIAAGGFAQDRHGLGPEGAPERPAGHRPPSVA